MPDDFNFDMDNTQTHLVELIAACEAECLAAGGQHYFHINVCSSTGRQLTQAEIAVVMHIFNLNHAIFLPDHAKLVVTNVDIIKQIKKL